MLFDASELTAPYLHILLNGKISTMPVASLFDCQAYDSLFIASFVASPEYLFKKLKGFKHLKIILGEEESARTLTSLDIDKEISFIKAIDSVEMKEKILSKAWDFKAMPPHMSLHSKIYLLEGPTKSRVMVGSANLSRQAFEGKQFEELLVFDDPQIVTLYKERFNAIWDMGVSWLSQHTMKRLKNVDLHAHDLSIDTIDQSIIHTQSIQGGTFSNSIIITPEFKAELLHDKIDVLRHHDSSLQLAFESLETDVSESMLLTQEIKKQSELMDLITKKNKGLTFFIFYQELGKIKENLTQALSINSKKSESFMHLRPNLVWDKIKGGLYLAHDELAEPLRVVEENNAHFKDQLERLAKFIRSYSLFTTTNSKENEKKIFEAILTALISPLMWMIRKELSDERGKEKLAEAPVILILGGHANSGKSKLLHTLSLLCGNTFDVFSYKAINRRSQVVLDDMMSSENLFPIFVDEIEKGFFEGDGGQGFIKYITNKHPVPSPCLIGTTNIEFAPRAEIVRRISYLHFSDTFPMDNPKMKKEADRYLKDEVGVLDQTLFYYLLDHMTSLYKEGDPLIADEDPLGIARQICKEAFIGCGITPDFIAMEPLGDFYHSGSLEWKAFYFANRKEFKGMKEEGNECLIIDIDKLYGSNFRKVEQIRNKLPPDVVKANGTPMVLRKKEFLSFIGVEQSWFQKWRG